MSTEPFSGVLDCPSRQRGRIGEQLIARWREKNNFSVRRSPDAEADLLINGRRVEIKLWALWRIGIYKF